MIFGVAIPKENRKREKVKKLRIIGKIPRRKLREFSNLVKPYTPQVNYLFLYLKQIYQFLK